MAKSKKPAARKSGGNTGKSSAAKSAAVKSSASAAAAKASSVVADAKASTASVDAKASSASADVKERVAKASTAVSPSEMKKQLEASAKPVPEVAKEPSGTAEIKEDIKEKAETKANKAPVEKATAEKAAIVAPPPPAEPAKQRSGFVPLVFGGVVAAGLGYLASEMNYFGTRGASDDLRTSVESQDTRLSALESAAPAEVDLSSVDSLALQVAASTGKLEELGASISDVSGRLETLQGESTAMAGQLDEVSTRLDEINTRLTDVEKRPITENESSEAAVAAYERELAALTASITEQRSELQSSIDEQRADLQSAVDAQRAEVEALLDNAITVEEAAAEAARVASIQKALTGLTSAIDAGQPFDAPLAALAEQGVEDVPAALSDVAADGVQTLSALQSRFPDSARASLGAARATGENNEEEAGVGGFLRRQLGARSVTPREGNGPDAVLSRAEAAVSEGRLDDALGELDALPAPAQEAMQDWLDSARARAAALVATQDLSQSLTAN